MADVTDRSSVDGSLHLALDLCLALGAFVVGLTARPTGRSSARPVAMDGLDGALVVLHDSTAEWLEQERLSHYALYDPLTGLANRYLLLEELRRMLQGLGRSEVPDGDLVVSRLRKVMSAPFRVRGQAFEVGASVGWVSTDRDGVGPDALLAQADRAMYRHERDRAPARRPLP